MKEKFEFLSKSEGDEKIRENLAEKEKENLEYLFKLFDYSAENIEKMKNNGVNSFIDNQLYLINSEKRESYFSQHFEQLSPSIKEWFFSSLIKRSIVNDMPFKNKTLSFLLKSCSKEYCKKAFANINLFPVLEELNEQDVKNLSEQYEKIDEIETIDKQKESPLELGKNKVKLFLEQEGIPSQEASFLAQQDIFIITLYKKGILDKEKLSSYIKAIEPEDYSVSLEPSLFFVSPFVSCREQIIYNRFDELKDEEVFNVLHGCNDYFLDRFFNEISEVSNKKLETQCFNNFIRLFKEIRWNKVRQKSSVKEYYYTDYVNTTAVEKLEEYAQRYLDKIRLSHGVSSIDKITPSMAEKIIPSDQIPEEIKKMWSKEHYKDLSIGKFDIEDINAIIAKFGGMKYSHTTQFDVEMGLDRFVFTLLTTKDNPYAKDVEFVINKKLVELEALCTYNDIMDIKSIYPNKRKEFSLLPPDVQDEKIRQLYEKQKVKLSQLKYLLAELDKEKGDYENHSSCFGGLSVKDAFNWNGFEVKLPAVNKEEIETIIVKNNEIKNSLIEKGFKQDKIVIKE